MALMCGGLSVLGWSSVPSGRVRRIEVAGSVMEGARRRMATIARHMTDSTSLHALVNLCVCSRPNDFANYFDYRLLECILDGVGVA